MDKWVELFQKICDVNNLAGELGLGELFSIKDLRVLERAFDKMEASEIKNILRTLYGPQTLRASKSVQ
jgi:hypothetical protein